jgi:hypothetical protein
LALAAIFESMKRFVQAFRIAALAALPFLLVGGYIGWKIYHQMHTPIGVLVIEERH